MATDENIIVAIELGSSKITGIAGRKQPDGGIQVLAVAQEPSSTFIRKGRVFNIEKTKQCLTNIREKLSKDLNKPISQAYVGIGGQGLMTSLHTVQRQLGTQTGITAEIVDSLLDNNLNTPMGNREILEVIPQEYKVGTQTQVDPIGVLTDSIEGRFLNVTAVPTLRENIERFFGATVEGYATYRYYEGNDILRSWICIPLVMDIFERREATVAALLSPRLWTENGMLTAAGSDTFWDRTTLYALRGIYAAGFREEATERLRFYSQTRLLGEHVPYAVEAWPEGDQRHLSAESGLYCRIVTEGMFGFRPTGFRSFTLTPQLPDAWNQMTLRRMYACAERPYDIIVKRTGKKLHIRIERDGSCIRKYTADNGTTIRIEL